MAKTFSVVKQTVVNPVLVINVPNEAGVSVGDGATFGWGSDRYPATVIKVTAKTVTIQNDRYEHVAGSGSFTSGSGYPKFTYTPNFAGATHVVRLTKRGWKSPSAGTVSFGRRDFYQDPHF